LPFLRYWRNSEARRALKIAHDRAPLIRRSIADHRELANMAGASHLLRPIGWSKVFYTRNKLEHALKDAEAQSRNFGVSFVAMTGREVAEHEPGLNPALAGGLHWPSPVSVSDPYALTMAYLDLFRNRGGTVHKGDARSLESVSSGWTVATETGPVTARQVVISMGPWSPLVYQTLGYSLPFFVMRGYHQHFGIKEGGQLDHPVLDAENGYFLVPMRQGVRLTTGAEFARRDAAPNPVQLERALPKARQLFPALGDALEPEPWVGARPCMPDMMPVIGPAPRHPGAWFAMGHAHHGLTMGPTTGKLLADLITGETPFTDPVPYSVSRFS
jgi:D-amino-acid dehydrogenase